MRRSLLFPGSARVSRAGFGVSPKQSLRKVREDETSSPARETRALPECCSDDLRTDFCARQAAEDCGLAARAPQIASVPQSERQSEILRVLRLLRG